jgi:two-component system, cell cycle sensor histidine kinase and response regulator CckA
MDPSQADPILANLCVDARDAIAEARALPAQRPARSGRITIETANAALDAASCAAGPAPQPPLPV